MPLIEGGYLQPGQMDGRPFQKDEALAARAAGSREIRPRDRVRLSIDGFTSDADPRLGGVESNLIGAEKSGAPLPEGKSIAGEKPAE